MLSLLLQDQNGYPQGKEGCTQSEAVKLSGVGQEHVVEHSEDNANSGDDVPVDRASSSDEEEHDHNSSDASSGSASSSGRSADAQDSAAEDEEDRQDAASLDMNQEAECSADGTHSQDGNPGSKLLPTQDLLVVHHQNLSLIPVTAGKPTPPHLQGHNSLAVA